MATSHKTNRENLETLLRALEKAEAPLSPRFKEPELAYAKVLQHDLQHSVLMSAVQGLIHLAISKEEA